MRLRWVCLYLFFALFGCAKQTPFAPNIELLEVCLTWAEWVSGGEGWGTHAIVLQSPFLLLDQNEWGSNYKLVLCMCMCMRVWHEHGWIVSPTDYITTKWIVVNSIVFHNTQTHAYTHTNTNIYSYPFSIVFHFDCGGRACAHYLVYKRAEIHI